MRFTKVKYFLEKNRKNEEILIKNYHFANSSPLEATK